MTSELELKILSPRAAADDDIDLDGDDDELEDDLEVDGGDAVDDDGEKTDASAY